QGSNDRGRGEDEAAWRGTEAHAAAFAALARGHTTFVSSSFAHNRCVSGGGGTGFFPLGGQLLVDRRQRQRVEVQDRHITTVFLAVVLALVAVQQGVVTAEVRDNHGDEGVLPRLVRPGFHIE